MIKPPLLTVIGLLNQPSLTILGTFPGFQTGISYSYDLEVAGGSGPYEWTISAGSLPTGLFLDHATGTVSGTPSSSSDATFTVHVEDVNGLTTDRVMTIFVIVDAQGDYVVLLNHWNGANGSTTFTDERSAVTWARNGTNVAIDTSQSVFGGASIRCPGNSGDWIQTQEMHDLGFETFDYTLEGWVRFNALPGGTQKPIFEMRFGGVTNQANPLVYLGTDNVVRVYYNGSVVITGGTLTTATWYHVVLCRSSNITKLFINGTQAGSDWSDSNDYNGSSRLRLGQFNDSTERVDAWWDEIRVTKGYARYTTTFTVPTSPFAVGSTSRLDDTWTTSGNIGPGLTFYDQNHSVVRNIVGNDDPDNGTMSQRARNSGKAYVEAKMYYDSGGWCSSFGVLDPSTDLTTQPAEAYTTGAQLAWIRGFSGVMRLLRAGVASEPAQETTNPGVMSMAIDFDTGQLWMRVNDNWIKGSDLSKTTTFPSSDPTWTFTPGTSWKLFATTPFAGTDVQLNLGPVWFRTPPTGYETAWW